MYCGLNKANTVTTYCILILYKNHRTSHLRDDAQKRGNPIEGVLGPGVEHRSCIVRHGLVGHHHARPHQTVVCLPPGLRDQVGQASLTEHLNANRLADFEPEREQCPAQEARAAVVVVPDVGTL